MLQKQKYIQLFGDVLIPLLGYFYWNWSFYFIVLFYLLDLLVQEIIMHLKSKKIHSFKNEVNIGSWIKNGSSSLILLTVIVLLIHLTLKLQNPEINFVKEIFAFLQYTELGIQQGYVLIPLLILVGYQSYKMEFLMPKLFEKVSLIELWRKHQKALFILFGFCSIALTLSYFIRIPDVLLLFSIIVLTSAYALKFKA